MNKKLLRSILSVLLVGIVYFTGFHEKESKKDKENQVITTVDKKVKKTKKTPEERALFAQERLEHELKFQRNPTTGEIPLEEKEQEFTSAMNAKDIAAFNRKSSRTYTSRGPSNLGGRTRALRVDLSDNTSNTIIAGGVSSGLFRTTNGGTTWTKVSPNDDIHNVTALAQDPRPGSQNIWYYGTGERRGNSASLGSAFRGRGVWKSIDSGVTWTQIAATNSTFDLFDSDLDYVNALEVNPTNGHLMIAADATIYRFDGTTLTKELEQTSPSTAILTDVVINSLGRVFASFHGAASTHEGVWTSPTGTGSWTRIAQNGTPTGWAATARIVLGIAPSNTDVIYALYVNGNSGAIEADLWHYNLGTNTWTDYSSKLPDEPGGDSPGNDPFAVQGGYDLVVSVKPDDENLVVIGGTNAYKINNITTDATFVRIGGYANNSGYSPYFLLGSNEHHPDIHELHFDPHNSSRLFSGTDGGVHRTPNIGFAQIGWTSLNNDYLTYQYYHVAMDPTTGSNIVFGGAQDNGSTYGGTDVSSVTFPGKINPADNSTMYDAFSGDGVAVALTRRGSNLQLYYGSQNGNIRTNYPGGFRSLIPDGSDSQFVTYFYLDPDNTNALYYAGKVKLYKTADAENVITSNWDDLGSITGSNLRTFATTRGAYSASSYLLVGDESGKVFRLDDPQNATIASIPVDITPAGATTAAGAIVSGLSIHPTNPDIAIATYANYGITNIFITSNATSATPTWTAVERNLSSHSVRSAAVTVVGGQIIYFVGTARGLYSSEDPTTTDWEIEGATEMGLPVVSSLVYRPSDNKLLVGTHGNGMYETTVVANTLSTNDTAKNELGATIYPNPAQNELNIKGSQIDFNSDVKYQISDIRGRVIKKGVLSNRKVDVSGLNSGIYIINLESKGLTGSLKFLKE